MNDVRALRAFIFDMDGVIYVGGTVLPGAPEMIAGLRRAKVPYLFLTNNSTAPPRLLAGRLQTMGIDAVPEDVLTSGEATAAMLAAERPGCRVYLVGETGIREALENAGFVLTRDCRAADAVVVGLDREIAYAGLRDAALAIQRGALFLATNTDVNLPSEDGLIPGAGSLVGLLEIATGVQARSIGKPSPGIFRMALRRLGSPAAATAAVGDRPETDIAGGQAAGLRTIAVLTGAGTREAFAAMHPGPDWIFADLNGLREAYFRPS